MIEIYNFDCTQPEAHKFSQEILNIKTFPAYRLYPIENKRRKMKSKKVLYSSKKLKDLKGEISDLVEDSTISLDPESMSSYLEGVVSTRSPSLILFHDQDEISLSLRVLAQLDRYKNNIRFANIKNPPADLKDHFSVKRFPTLIVAFVNEPDKKEITFEQDIQIATYTSGFNYPDLRYFLETVI